MGTESGFPNGLALSSMGIAGIASFWFFMIAIILASFLWNPPLMQKGLSRLVLGTLSKTVYSTMVGVISIEPKVK